MSDSKAQAVEAKGRGNAAFKAGDHAQAVQEFTTAIELDPTNQVYYSNRAMVYTTMGKFEEALVDGKKCIELKEDWAKGYSRAGVALWKLGRLEEAAKLYEEGLAKTDNDASLQQAHGQVMGELQQRSNPMAKLFGPEMWTKLGTNPETAALLAKPGVTQKLQALQGNPNLLSAYAQDPDIMKCIGVILGIPIMAGGPGADGAPDDGPSAMDTTPTTPTQEPEPTPEPEPEPEPELTPEEQEERARKAKALEEKERGNTLFKKKQLDEALAAYTEAINLDPTNAVYRSNRAAVYFSKKDYDGCMAECKQAIQIGQEHRADFKTMGRLWSRVAACHRSKNELELAIEAYQKSLLEHYDQKTKRLLQQTKEMKKKLDEKAYLNPELSNEAKSRGNQKFQEGKWADAIEAYTEAIKRDPTNIGAYSNRAFSYTKLMQWGPALEDCDKCISLDPNFVKAYIRKGKIQHFLKQYHKALDTYKAGMAIPGQESNAELQKLRQDTAYAIAQANASGEVDEARQREALKDPEIQAILRDPSINMVLKAMQEDPSKAQAALQDAGVRGKLEKLVAAGIVRMG